MRGEARKNLAKSTSSQVLSQRLVVLFDYSIQTIIQFHSELKFRTLEEIWNESRLRHIILRYTSGRWLST